jgi:hypothetical protein
MMLPYGSVLSEFAIANNSALLVATPRLISEIKLMILQIVLAIMMR